jgi:hypothetical protein
MPDVKLLTVESDGSVSPALDLAAPELSGFDALFQRVVLTLLKSPRSDVQDEDDGDGGGLQQLIFSGIGGDDPAMMAAASEVVRRARRSLSIEQDRANLPAAERMRELQVLSLDSDASSGSLAMRLRLVSGTNQTASRTVVVG